MDKYNFYNTRQEENPDDFSFSVFEIHKQQQEKEDNRMLLYNRILKRVFTRIKLAVDNSESYCFFQLPEFIPGFPIYNMTECLFYIQNYLTSKGFEHKYCNDLIVFITWKPKEKSLKLENLNKNKPKMIGYKEEKTSNNQPKYRSINDYKPKGDFLYNCNRNKLKKNPIPKKKELFLNF